MKTPLHVIVYVKPECGLCGPMTDVVTRLQPEFRFTFEKIDIERDPALFEKYKHEIPVLMINGRKAFKGRVEEAALRKKLERAQQEPAGETVNFRALEELEPAPWTPPAWFAALFLAATLAGVAFFVAQGVERFTSGRGALAADLLNVAPRGDTPVGFALEAMSGGKQSLNDYAGKVVFLNFWATWCPPCIEEMPSMLRLQERMKGDPRFVMLAVSTDESWVPVRKFFAERGDPGFAVLLDQKGQIAKDYGTTMFPETYVIVDGKVIGFIEGPRNWDDWFAEGYLRSLL